MHEMGEMKRAQELRVDEVSVQKLRENHETIQKLTSQLQEMEEQMNPMNDSGEFQKVESNYSGRLPCVSSQPAVIPSSRSMLSRDKRLPLDTWNTSGSQENVLVINYLRLIHPEIILKEFTLAHHKENEDQFHKLQGQGLLSQEMTNKIETQCQFRRILWLDSKDSKFRNCNPTNSKIHIQKSSDCLFLFSIGSNVVDQRSGGG